MTVTNLLDVRHIAFVGDSITEEWFRFRGEVLTRHHCINMGKGGENTSQMRERFLSNVLDERVSGVHLMCGINDIAQTNGYISPGQTLDNMAYMVLSAKQLGLYVCVSSITPCKYFMWQPAVPPNPAIAELNAKIYRLCMSAKVSYIDYFPILSEFDGTIKEEFSPDGCHLNERGYMAIENKMLSHIIRFP